MPENSPSQLPKGLTRERQSLGGKRSVETRRRRKKPDEAARAALLKGVTDAAGVLVDVARAGEGFEEVKPELRLKAALVIMEYVLGKPKGFEDEKAEEEAPADPFAALLQGGGHANSP